MSIKLVKGDKIYLFDTIEELRAFEGSEQPTTKKVIVVKQKTTNNNQSYQKRPKITDKLKAEIYNTIDYMKREGINFKDSWKEVTSRNITDGDYYATRTITGKNISELKIGKTRGLTKLKDTNPEEYSKRSKRLTFMNKRANYYMRQYNWSREKAYGQAASDWKQNSVIEMGGEANTGLVTKEKKCIGCNRIVSETEGKMINRFFFCKSCSSNEGD